MAKGTKFCRKVLYTFGILAVLSAVYVGSLIQAPRRPILCTVAKLNCPEIVVRGYVAPGYEHVRDEFSKAFYAGEELGAQIAGYVNGELVVDLWGNAGTVPYDDNSLQTVFSSSKAVSSIAVAKAVDLGYFKYSDKVSSFWPEFAVHGKENFTVERVMRHEAGLAFLRRPIKAEELYSLDWDSIANLIADSTPYFENDTTRAYHAFTRDFISNEIIRRADPKHRTIGQFIKDEIADPLGVDFHLGTLPESQYNRVVPVEDYPLPYLLTNFVLPYFLNGSLSFIPKVSKNSEVVLKLMLVGNTISRARVIDSAGFDSLVPFVNDKRMLKTEGPSFAGLSNAKSLAKIALAAITGSANGVKIFSEATAKQLISKVDLKRDALANMDAAMTTGGVTLVDHIEWIGDFGNGFYGWGGLGGSVIVWNPEKNIAFSYAMTGMDLILFGNPKAFAAWEAFVKCAAKTSPKFK